MDSVFYYLTVVVITIITNAIYSAYCGASPGGSVLRNPPAMQELYETRVRSLGREESLEEGMETHSSILAWRIPWTEEPGRPQSIGSQGVRHDWSDLACMHMCQILRALCMKPYHPCSYYYSRFLPNKMKHRDIKKYAEATHPVSGGCRIWIPGIWYHYAMVVAFSTFIHNFIV